ncbi:MAG: tetratricopeptide repeat protein, partial [Myxococcota bacterium]
RGFSLESLEQSIQLLEEMGFIRRHGQDSLSVSHPLLRQVAYQLQSDEDRVARHRLAIVAFQERYPNVLRQAPALLMAHAIEAENYDVAREASVSAAERAVELRDYRSGLTLTDLGLDVCDRAQWDEPGARFDLLAAREHIHDARGNRAEQELDLARMLELAERLRDPRRRALAFHRAARLHLLSGNPQEAERLARDALAEAREGDPLDLSNVLRTVALIDWHRGDPQAAVASLREALTLYEELNHSRGMGMVLHNLGLFALDTGALLQARDHLERALSLKQRTGDTLGRAAVMDSLGQVALNEGRADAAAGAFEVALALRLEQGDQQGSAATRVMLSEALVETNPARAEILAKEALDSTRRKRRLARTRIEATVALARARLALNKRDPASRSIAKAVDEANALGAPLLRIRAQLTQAEINLTYSSKRRLERAIQLSRSAVETARDAGAHRWRIEALSVLSQALRASEPEAADLVADEVVNLLDDKTPIGLDRARILSRCGRASQKN